MRRARLLLLLVVCIAPAVAAVGYVLFRAQRTLGLASVTARDRGHLAFDLRPIDPAHELAANPGFVPIATPSGFVCGAFFHGELYLGGQTGLSVFGPDGTPRRSLRSGIELPPGPVLSLAVSRLRSASASELLIGTGGHGLLILTEQGALRQLLPGDSGARDIVALLPLPTGDLLLGTRHRGLLLYSGTTLEQVPIPVAGLDAARLQITALAPDPTGFWAATRNAGLLHLHGGAMDHVDRTNGLPDDQVDSLAVTATHTYAGTPLGVAELDAQTQPVRVLAAASFAHVLAVDANRDELLLGTLDQGIEQVALSPRLRPVAMTLPDTTDAVQQFLSADGVLYAITASGVLRKEDSGARWSEALEPAEATLTDGNISALAFAPDGRLWVGFFDRGLDVLSPELMRATHMEDDRLSCINRLVLDPRRNTMAAATANGLVLFDAQGHPRQTLTRRDGLIADHVNDLAFTPQGMAVATPAGITFVDATSTASLYVFQGLVNNHVYALGVRGRQMLAGTLGGISVLDAADEAVKTNLTVTNSNLGHNWITAVVAAPDGGWDVGTYGAGVLHMAPDGHFSAMQIPANTAVGKQGIIVNPNAMLATEDALYAGTLGHGLYVYDRPSAHWSEVSHGLPSENVTALAERAGELYVGTDSGLVRIAESALKAGAR
jgi:hypothetical protein